MFFVAFAFLLHCCCYCIPRSIGPQRHQFIFANFVLKGIYSYKIAMELHPIFDKETFPNSKLWYVVSAVGDSPSVRVGHTCTYIPGPEGTDGKVYVIGGANPSGPFAEVFVLDLQSLSWDTIDAPGFKARYEHSAFVPESEPHKIYVFGGADQSGNHNDIQVLDTRSKTWEMVTPSGSAPSPRTYHTTVCVGDRFVVYSGGHQGSDPVGDRQVHVFNAASCAWSTLNVRGDPPKPRHGHIAHAVGHKVYIHGGMSGPAFYDDLHVLDVDACTWRSVKQKRVRPPARAAHASCAHHTDIYVFGGMNRDGALDDTWKLDTSELTALFNFSRSIHSIVLAARVTPIKETDSH